MMIIGAHSSNGFIYPIYGEGALYLFDKMADIHYWLSNIFYEVYNERNSKVF